MATSVTHLRQVLHLDRAHQERWTDFIVVAVVVAIIVVILSGIDTPTALLLGDPNTAP